MLLHARWGPSAPMAGQWSIAPVMMTGSLFRPTQAVSTRHSHSHTPRRLGPPQHNKGLHEPAFHAQLTELH